MKLLLEAHDLEDYPSKILRTFYDYGGNSIALRFYRAFFSAPTTPAHTLSLDDAIVCVNVLLSNGLIQEAIEFQRNFVTGGRINASLEAKERSTRNKKIQILLFHIFRHCVGDCTYFSFFRSFGILTIQLQTTQYKY